MLTENIPLAALVPNDERSVRQLANMVRMRQQEMQRRMMVTTKAIKAMVECLKPRGGCLCCLLHRYKNSYKLETSKGLYHMAYIVPMQQTTGWQCMDKQL